MKIPPLPETEITPLHGLTDKQVAFVFSYVEHRNAARAAREAGYAKGRARKHGYDLLLQPKIRGAVDFLTAHLFEAEAVTRRLRQGILLKAALASLGTKTDGYGNELPIDPASAIAAARELNSMAGPGGEGTTGDSKPIAELVVRDDAED